MAVQHLFVYSSQVEGAAIAAGSPYGCGAFPEGQYDTPDGNETCYYGGTNISKTLSYIQDRFENGFIDDPSNLKSTPVIVFNGKSDWVVYTNTSQDILTQLSHFVQSDKLVSKLDTNAAHVWSVDHPVGNHSCWCGRCSLYLFGCGVLSPCGDVNNCGYDLAGDMFRRSYGTIKPRTKARQVYSWVPQRPYLPLPSEHRFVWNNAALLKWAIVYVPTNCVNNTAACRVHVNYHGCIANHYPQRLIWVNNLDLNEYGEANDIIIVYPQAGGDHNSGNGCWNWGAKLDDRLFDTKHGAQLAMVMNLVADLENATKLAVELPQDKGPPRAEEGEEEDYVAVGYEVSV